PFLIHVPLSARPVPCFLNDKPTTSTYPLSLHDALPIFSRLPAWHSLRPAHRWSCACGRFLHQLEPEAQSLDQPDWRHPFRYPVRDRKSTRLNSSHVKISYAVFCLKKKT